MDVPAALHRVWKAAGNYSLALMSYEIYAEPGGFCEEVFMRTRRATKHWSMLGGPKGPAHDDLLMVLVHADASWTALMLQQMGRTHTLIPVDMVELEGASAFLQESVHDVIQPRMDADSPMPPYHFLHGALMRACQQGDAERGEHALRALFSTLPEARPASFAAFSRILMNTHRDSIQRGLPSTDAWGDAVQAAVGLGRAIHGVMS